MAQRVNIEVLNKAAVDVQVQNSNAINVEVPTAPRDFVPRFTADKTEVEQVNSVDFSASEAGFEYYWGIQDTGGFIFKSGKNVSHQYDNIGEFDVALTQADLSKQKSGIQVKRNFIKVVEPDALLDKPFAIGATAAYSLRKLKSSATKAVRVREDSGNTETDIGFSGTLLDETALLNHCGSANGFVTKWYDQSGNGNDASNSNASDQPQIVNSGSVIKENGKPAVQGNGGQELTGQLDKTIATQPFEIFAVVQYSSINDFTVAVANFDSSRARILLYTINNELRIFAGSVLSKAGFTNNSQILHGGLYNGGNSELFLDGSRVATGNANNRDYKGITLFNQNPKNGDNFFKGKLQEVIIYNSDKSSNRNKIETNINNHYSIF